MKRALLAVLLLLSGALALLSLLFLPQIRQEKIAAQHSSPTPVKRPASTSTDQPTVAASQPIAASAAPQAAGPLQARQHSDPRFVTGPRFMTSPSGDSSTPKPNPQIADRWPQAITLFTKETSDKTASRRITILQPTDLPYPIRIEETLGPDGTVSKISEMVANRILVSPQPGQEQEFLNRVAALGARAEKLGSSSTYRVTLREARPDSVPSAIAQFTGARYAEPDYIVHALATPNDPFFLDGTLWGLHNTGQNGGTADADIDAPEGWDIRNSAPNVIVGVIDTGVRYTHEDIAANMWVNPGEDGTDALGNSKRTNGLDDDGNGFIDDVYGINAITGSGNPMDDNGHGSHCAGTIAAVGNNAKGVTGVAWNAKIMALKFLSSSGSGALSDSIICIDYATNHGATFTSNSWGGGDYSQAIADAIARARNAGKLFIAAAGNSENDNDIYPSYPASIRLENVIAVAATTRTDTLASFSNYGSGSVEIGAPGVSIHSLGIASDSDYRSLNGTSMATPHVAGLAALLHAHFPSSDSIGIRNRLLRGGRPLAALAGKTVSGRLINVPDSLNTTTDAPPNDDFESGLTLGADPEVMRSTNRHATTQPGEPLHAGHNTRSVWFRHTATTTGSTVVSTTGSAIDTVLAVYQGDSLTNLTLLASNDNDGTLQTSRVSFTAQAGVTYHIAVAGKNGAQGYIEVNVSGPPKEDNLANPAVPPSFPFIFYSNNTNASRETGEPLHAGQPGGGSLWLRFRLADYGAASQRVVLTTEGSSIDTLLGVYTAPTSNPAMADLVPVVSNDNAPYGTTQSEVTFLANASTTYWIAIDGKNNARGAVQLWAHSQPANDNFSDAIALSPSATATIEVPITTLYQATREPGEPTHDNAGRGNSLWWTWSPPADGAYVLRTDANTALGVYTGSSVTALTLAAPDNNDGTAFSEVVLTSARADTTYRIALDRRPNTSGFQPIRIFIEPYAVSTYDAFASAAVVEGIPSAEVPVSFRGSNANAGRESGEPTGPGYMERTVWVKWTAPVSGLFAADTHWTSFDSSLAVYSGPANATSFAQLTYIKGELDRGIHDDAWLWFQAVAGQTYYFQIGGYDTTEFGEFNLNITPFAPPANDNFANAETLTSFFIQREVANFGSSREPGEPDHATNDDWHNDDNIFYYNEVPRTFQTLWYKWTPANASQARRTTASAFGSGTYSIVAVYETTAANPTFSNLTMVTPGASMMWGSWWPWGEISWNAQLGKTYYIVLGFDIEGNNEVMAFSFWQNPNDAFATRQLLPSQSNLTTIGANYAATRESGEPVITNPWNYQGGRSQWFEWVAPESGVFAIDTYGSHNKSYFGRTSPTPARNTMQMLLGVYTGNSLSGLTTIGTNAGMSTRDYNARVIFNAVAGTSYKIALDTRVGPGAVLNQPRTQWVYRTNTQLNITRGEMANDHLANAKVITGTYHSEFTDISFATREPGEPTHGTRALKSAWWKWTAPESGTFWVATASDIFSTQHNRLPGIAVYSGPYTNPTFSALTKLAEHSGGPDSHNPARTSFTAIAGNTYYIAVDTGGSTADFYGFGTGLFLGRAAPNDNFANATVVTGSRRTVTGHNIGSTEQTGEPNIDPSWKHPDAKNSSVWWRWTAPASGQVTIRTKPGSFIWSELGIYTGSAVNALTEVAKEITGNHFDNGNTYEERMDLAGRSVTFNAVAGTTYHILVIGSGYRKTSQGLITLTIEGQPGQPFAPTNLKAIRVNDNRVDLTWTDEAVDESTYVIQRATSASGPWTTVFASGEADTTAWSDLEASGTLYYRVRAEGPGGVSDWATTSTNDNYAPTITPISDQLILLNGTSGPLAFTIGDDRTDPAALTVTASSSNQTRIPNSGLVLGGSGADRTLTVNPAPGQLGNATITLSVSDGTHTTQTAFNVVVADPNLPVATSITVTPGSATLQPGATRQYSAVLRDQYGRPMDPQPASFTWSVSGGGTINSTGLVTAGSTPGTYTVTASASGVNGFATFTVPAPYSGPGTFSDSFDDGNRTDGTDPNDVAWFYQKASSGLTVTSGGGLTNALSFNSNNNAASLFAALPATIALTNPGDYIQVTFRYSRTASSNPNFNSGVRVALLYQDGLPTADNYGTATSPTWDMTGLDAATGYLAGFPSGTNSEANIRKDTNAASNNSTSTTHNYLIHNQKDNTGILGTTSTAAGLKLPDTGSAGLPVTIRLRIEKTATGVQVTTGLTPAGGSETTLVRDDTTSPITSFNAVAFGTSAINQVNYYDDIVVTTNVSSATGYELWANTSFPTGTPPADTQPGADPDGDGIPNLLEYALGGDPLAPGDQAKLPAIGTTQVSGQDRLTLTFTPQNTDGLQFFIQASTDLSDWSDQTEVTSQLTEGQLFTFTDSVNLATTPRRFLRLRVSQSP